MSIRIDKLMKYISSKPFKHIFLLSTVFKSVLKSKSRCSVSLKYWNIFTTFVFFVLLSNGTIKSLRFKMVSLPCQNGTSAMLKWYLCHVKMVPLPCQDGTSAMSKWILCHVKMIPLPCLNGFSAMSKWTQNLMYSRDRWTSNHRFKFLNFDSLANLLTKPTLINF